MVLTGQPGGMMLLLLKLMLKYALDIPYRFRSRSATVIRPVATR